MNKRAQDFIWAIFIVLAAAVLAIFIAMPIEYKLQLIREIEGNNTITPKNNTYTSNQTGVTEVELGYKETIIAKDVLVGDTYFIIPIARGILIGGEYKEKKYKTTFSLFSSVFDTSKSTVKYYIQLPECENLVLYINGSSIGNILVKIDDVNTYAGPLNGIIEIPLSKKNNCTYKIELLIDQPFLPFRNHYAYGTLYIYKVFSNKLEKKIYLPSFKEGYLSIYLEGPCSVKINNKELGFTVCNLEDFDITSYIKEGENIIEIYSSKNSLLHNAYLKVVPKIQNRYDILLKLEQKSKIKDVKLLINIEEGKAILYLNNKYVAPVSDVKTIDITDLLQEGYNIITIYPEGIVKIREIRVYETYYVQ